MRILESMTYMILICAILAMFMVMVASVEVSMSPFLGIYSDPNHPDCYRKVMEKMPSQQFFVYGQDNKGGEGVSCTTDDPTQLDNWGPCPATANSTHITVDLSSKGGPADLTGEWDAEANRIVWADGNYWQHQESNQS